LDTVSTVKTGGPHKVLNVVRERLKRLFFTDLEGIWKRPGFPRGTVNPHRRKF